MQEPALDFESDLSDFFSEVVQETLEGRADEPAPIVLQYLIGLLEDSALSLGEGPVESVLDAPLAVQLAHALHAPSSARFDKLRILGDGILVLGGLYEPYLKRAGLGDEYVTSLGSRAYASASSLMAPGLEAPTVGAASLNLLERMAENFSTLMSLLRDVSDTLTARSVFSAGDLAKLYERWFQRRSTHLERLLRKKGGQVGGLLVC